MHCLLSQSEDIEQARGQTTAAATEFLEGKQQEQPLNDYTHFFADDAEQSKNCHSLPRD